MLEPAGGNVRPGMMASCHPIPRTFSRTICRTRVTRWSGKERDLRSSPVRDVADRVERQPASVACQE